MAKQIIDKNGHLCIEMTVDEAVNECGFGIPYTEAICDNCNTLLTLEQREPVYFVAVLYELFCKDCFDDYIENAPYYEEDKEYEKNNYNYYAKILNLELL